MADPTLHLWLGVGAWIFAALTLGAGVAILGAARRDPQTAIAAFAAAQGCVAGVAAASGASAAAFALAALGVGFSALVFAAATLASGQTQAPDDARDGLQAGPLAILAPAGVVVFGLIASAQVAPFQPDRVVAVSSDAPALHLAVAALFAATAFALPAGDRASPAAALVSGGPAAAVAALVPLISGLAVGVIWLSAGGITAALGAGGAIGLAFALYSLAHGLAAARKAAPAAALKAIAALGVAGLLADAVLRAGFSMALRPEAVSGCLALTVAAATTLAFFAIAETARGRA